ncbi:MAG: hypothetical protein JKX76_01835 [Colwellia sp.]|nr:hypothetical protein [Colwellia sp.]
MLNFISINKIMSNLQIDNKRFWCLLISAFIVISAIIIENGGGQYYKSKGTEMKMWAKWAGMALFMLGWIGVIFSIAMNSTSTKVWMSCIAGVLIVGSVMIMMIAKMYSSNNTIPAWAKYFGISFILGWILLGYSASIGGGSKALMYGLGASAAAVVSMMVALPFQRKYGIVDGPGMALFALGFTSLAISNAI